MNDKRKRAEELIYKVYDEVDKTKTNSDYYKKLFATMSDAGFYNFCKRRLPFRFHINAFKIEPKMGDIIGAFKILKKPLLEKVRLRHVYINKNGVPVESKECLVIYIHLKRMKQMITKKNNTPLNTDKRDMKSGLLTGGDKGGKETDREFESLAIMGNDETMNEFARPRADAMAAKAQMSSAIMSKGFVSKSDLSIASNDSIGKNLVNVYLIGAHLHSNLVDIDYVTPYTAKNKKQDIKREV